MFADEKMLEADKLEQKQSPSYALCSLISIMLERSVCVLMLLQFVGSDFIAQRNLKDNKILIALSDIFRILSATEISSIRITSTSQTANGDDSLNQVLRELESMPVQLMELEVSSKTASLENSLNVFWVEDGNEIFRLWKNLKPEDGKVLLIISNSKPEKSKLAEVFGNFSALHIYDVNILSLEGEVAVMKSFFPFQENKCRNTSPVVINAFNETSQKWNSEEIFPTKLKNFFKCPLRITTLEYPPAVMQKFHNGLVEYYGSDVEVIRGLSSAMNFTADFAFVAEPYNFGQTLEKNSTGAIAHVVEGTADIAMGFYFLIHAKLRFLSYSSP